MSDETNPGTAQQPRICQVIVDYQAFYPDPVSVNAGESFYISEKLDYWNGNPNWTWIWCTDQRGKSGWVPKEWIDFSANGTVGTTRYTYTATELTVAVGDELVVEREASGWLWCTNQQGKSGWVPADHVKRTYFTLDNFKYLNILYLIPLPEGYGLRKMQVILQIIEE